jgi:xanthine dehydrogenase small subunit
LPEYFSQIEDRLELLNNELLISQADLSTDQSLNFVAGGTDLYVQKHDSMTNAKISFTSEKSFLKGITKEGNRCIMGASTTVADLCESEVISAHFPAFAKYAKLVSSTQIRNMATLAGNFVNASPIGDFTVFFLALDAVLVLSDGEKIREVRLRNFYKGYKVLDKNPEEFLEKIYFELPDSNSKFNFEKVSKRTHLDIASVNTAMKLTLRDTKITKANVSAGGVAPVPLFLSKVSEFLSGKLVSFDIIEEAIQIAQTEISPISDSRGSEEYKRLLLSQLIKAHFTELFPQIMNVPA